MAGTFTQLLVHLVFSTKERLPLIRRRLREPLYRYIGGIVAGERCDLLEIGGMPDHVHLLVRMRADLAVSNLVRRVKSNSSRWLNDHPRLGRDLRFGWQSGYGAFSVSSSSVGSVRRYIRNQEEHHKVRGFDEELATLLEKHGVTFEQRFLVEGDGG